jgi:hypothetical protein
VFDGEQFQFQNGTIKTEVLEDAISKYLGEVRAHGKYKVRRKLIIMGKRIIVDRDI